MEQALATSGELTPQESAYFESRGEAPVEGGAEGGQQQQSEGQQQRVEALDPAKLKEIADNHQKATKEERERRKAAEQRLRDLEIQNARYAERFSVLDRIQSEQRQPAQVPSPTEDPFKYIEHIPEQFKTLEQKLAQYEQREQQQAQHQQIVRIYAADAQRVKADHPEFDQAYQHVVGGFLAAAQAMGLSDPVAAAQAQELQIVQQALSNGRSPAEAFLSMAKAYGFAPKASDNGAAEKLDKIEQGQAANKSLGAAGGESGADNMTADALLKMPLDEFDAWCRKNSAKAKRLMGG